MLDFGLVGSIFNLPFPGFIVVLDLKHSFFLLATFLSNSFQSFRVKALTLFLNLQYSKYFFSSLVSTYLVHNLFLCLISFLVLAFRRKFHVVRDFFLWCVFFFQ